MTDLTSIPAAASPHRTGDLLMRIAERLGAAVSASAVYGDPVERDGVTVIPVAVARLGFGGGSGSDPKKQQEGEGAGGGGSVSPVGYIELREGRSRYVPIVHPTRMVAIVLAAVLAALFAIDPRPRRGKGARRR